MAGAICVLNGCLHFSNRPYSKARSCQSYVLGDHQLSRSKNIYHSFSNGRKTNDTTSPFSSAVGIQRLQHKFSASSTKSLYSRNILSFRHNPLKFSVSTVIYNPAYSSHAGNKGDDNWNATSKALSNSTDSRADSEIETLNGAHHSVVEVASIVGIKRKELSDEVAHQYDSYPYSKKVIVPITWTLFGTIVFWFIMPMVLRKFHKYASLAVSSNQEPVVYEKSFWSALEDPARYLITFIAFSQLGGMIAPTTLQYLPQAWGGAAVISFAWFLNRWKTNFFSDALPSKVIDILMLGTKTVAEACGMTVQFILTAGGVGVATACAVKDTIGNFLGWFFLRFSRPFTVEDYIKVGTVEGQVVEMGVRTTALITPERCSIAVPNSLFSSQVIVNKSHGQWRRAKPIKIRMCIDDLDKIPIMMDDIESMLRSNPNVHLENDAPCCYVSMLEDPFIELTVVYNLKIVEKGEPYAAELTTCCQDYQEI